MPLEQELFDIKMDATADHAEALARFSNETLAHMLAVQLLDNSMEVGPNFEFDPAEISGAKKVLCALMRGQISYEILDERDATWAALKETTTSEVLRRIHGATIGLIGVTMPGVGATIDG